jgi:V/A-type H+/Na+-transporting ATPase subunit I
VAIEKVSRVLVAVHQEYRDSFLKKLQRLGVMHITHTEAATPESQTNADSRRVIDAIETLTPRVKKKKGATGRKQVSRLEYDELAARFDHAATVERLRDLTREQDELQSRIRTIEAERRRLGPWSGLTHSPAEMYGLATVTVSFGRFTDEVDLHAAQDALLNGPAAIEVLGRSEDEIQVLVAAVPESAESVGRTLSENRFEVVDLRNVKGRPLDVLSGLASEADEAGKRLRAIGVEIEQLGSTLPELKVAADALANEEARKATAAALAKTESVALIHGWVRTRDMAKLNKLVADSGAAAMTEVQPAEGEEQPVALVNRPIFRPFEMVLELFSMPIPTELDPTWIIAPFFGVFFALCLTDAGYGVVVTVVAYLMMRKMGMNNKLLGIILLGAILTIPAGALVGGWFGDMPDRLGIGWLQSFKNTLMWFDPVKDPMKFFILSIGLGYVQMIAGIAFEIADCLRVRNYGDGLLGQLPWFLALNALTARVVFAKALPAWGIATLMVLILASVAAIIVFTQRSRETALSQTLWFSLFLAFLLFIGAKLHWLSGGFGLAKWGFWAVYLGMFAHAVVSMFRNRKFKPVPIVFGAVAAISLALYFARVLPAWIPSLVGVLFFLSSPSNATVLAKFLWGGYALYGATGYIGVVLSYIRLMALGMCTGGVAVAINVIAWMLLPVPVVGVIGAVIVLIIGHTYNIAVNVLGAFVHSLRLQYVEFFPRFYSGGGERFTPFRETNQFVSVKQ